MKRITNYRMFEVKYVGATNSNNSRVNIKDLRFNKSKTINYNYELSNIHDMAQQYLESKGIELVGKAESKNGYLMWTSDFNITIKWGDTMNSNKMIILKGSSCIDLKQLPYNELIYARIRYKYKVKVDSITGKFFQNNIINKWEVLPESWIRDVNEGKLMEVI